MLPLNSMWSFIPSHWFIIMYALALWTRGFNVYEIALNFAPSQHNGDRRKTSQQCYLVWMSIPVQTIDVERNVKLHLISEKKNDGVWNSCSLQVLGPLLGPTRRTPACHSWKARASSDQFLALIGQEWWSWSTPNQTGHWRPTSEQHA